MWKESQVYKEDLERIANCVSIDWTRFEGKTLFVTGATGLLGCTAIGAVIYACAKHSVNVQVLALVRNLEKAKHKFSGLLRDFDNLKFIVGDVCSLPIIEDKIDYILHGASITDSTAFVNRPVETIKTSVNGTIGLLELAKSKNVRSFVYLSSMEVYGFPSSSRVLKETDLDYINPLSVRSCYPESKRMSENLCISYVSEYHLNVKIARLAQSFGPGITNEDARVFAQFARNAQLGEDIVLVTKGLSERMYVYTMDAVSALIIILLSGKNGDVYNVANTNTYCSIKKMAELAAEALQKVHKSSILVRIDDNNPYSPNHYLYLDSSKLGALGWKPAVDLPEMFQRMCGIAVEGE